MYVIANGLLCGLSYAGAMEVFRELGLDSMISIFVSALVVLALFVMSNFRRS